MWVLKLQKMDFKNSWNHFKINDMLEIKNKSFLNFQNKYTESKIENNEVLIFISFKISIQKSDKIRILIILMCNRKYFEKLIF